MTRRGGSSQKDDYADGVSLVQATRTTDRSKRRKFRGKCHKCGKRGHFARDCTAGASGDAETRSVSSYTRDAMSRDGRFAGLQIPAGRACRG